jgi:hypothetical protein
MPIASAARPSAHYRPGTAGRLTKLALAGIGFRQLAFLLSEGWITRRRCTQVSLLAGRGICMLISLLPPPSVHAAVYYVSSTGNDQSARTNVCVEGESRYASKANGARLKYRYVDGRLRDGADGRLAQELWPWPVEQWIEEEPGISVTCELENLTNQHTAAPITHISPGSYCGGRETTAPTVPVNPSWSRNGSQIGTSPATHYSDNGLQPATTRLYTAAAFDAAGSVSTQSVAVPVKMAVSDTTAPTVALTAPSNGATVAGTIIVEAAASDNVGVAGIQFMLDGAKLGAEDATSPFSVSWNTSESANGLHRVTAVARDAEGNQVMAAVFTVTVANLSSSLGVVFVSDNTAFYPAQKVPRYAKFEATFVVNNTVATNLQIPYDADPPSGIDPNWNPLHKGISVDALFSPDNFATIYRQPAFPYQAYEDQLRPGSDGRNREWHYPIGDIVWKVRFAPNLSGTWQYKIIARDAGGTTESAVSSFAVSPSTDKGFIKVSAKDPRYFEFDDGTPFIPLGFNDALRFDDPTRATEPIYQTYAANGINLLRVWASSLRGSAWLEWLGGRNAYDGYLPRSGLEAFQDAASNKAQLTQALEYDGPNLQSAWYDACRFQFWDHPEPVKPYTNYRLRIKYRGAGIAGPRLAGGLNYGLVGKISKDWLPNCHEPMTGTVITNYGQNTSDWAMIEGTWQSGGNHFLPRIYFGLENVTQGRVLVDSVSLREDLGNGELGPEIINEPSMQYDLYFPQEASYSLDRIVSLAEQYGIYLKMVLEDKSDTIFQKMDDDGTYVLAGEQDNLHGFYGLGRKMNRTKWLHQAWWRYVQARWGYSPSIHSWELTNEGDPWLKSHYELADEFGKFMHCTVFGINANEGDAQKCTYRHPMSHLVTTSFWTSFPAGQFWKNAAYPNVDYADLHAYVSTSDIGITPNERAKMQWDSAYYHLGHSKEIGGWKLGKPAMRGEAGIDSLAAQNEQPDLAKDTEGIWLHKLLWSTLDSGAMPELYWWRSNIEKNPGPDGIPGLYEVFRAFSRFIRDIPLNNGNYAAANVTSSEAALRVVGQQDSVSGNAHLWIDNSNHTWKNVVDNVIVPPITGTVTVSGMPDGVYAVTLFDTYSGVTFRSTAESSGRTMTIPVSNLATDVAVKIERQGSQSLSRPRILTAPARPDVRQPR